MFFNKKELKPETVWDNVEGDIIKWDPFTYVPTVSTTREQAEAVQAKLNELPDDAWEEFVKRAS